MQPLSYARHQFPPEIIRHAAWLYLRFTLSYRDVEEHLAERGISVAYESVRRWVLKFGPSFARNLRRLRPRPASKWHLDEMVVSIQGRRMYLWRAIDAEGEVLDAPSTAAIRSTTSTSCTWRSRTLTTHARRPGTRRRTASSSVFTRRC